MGKTCPDNCCCMHCYNYPNPIQAGTALHIPRTFTVVVWENPEYGSKSTSGPWPPISNPLDSVTQDKVIFSGRVGHQNTYFDPHDTFLYSTRPEGYKPHENANDLNKAVAQYEIHHHTGALSGTDATNPYYNDTNTSGPYGNVPPLFGHHGGLESHIRALVQKNFYNNYDEINMGKEFLANFAGNQCWAGFDCKRCYNSGYPHTLKEDSFGSPISKKSVGYLSSECIPEGNSQAERPSVASPRTMVSGCNYHGAISGSLDNAITDFFTDVPVSEEEGL